MKRYVILLGCFMLAACSAGPIGNPHVPEPAKSVDPARYTGLWYEVARYENGFEKGCDGVTAAYAAREDRKIAVINTCHKKGVAGPAEIARGTAYIVDGSGNAKLRVSFFWPFYGDYWVLDHAEDYGWSIVGEPSGRYLWILSRQPVLSDTAMQALYNKAAAMGYDTALLYRTKQRAAR